MTNVCKNLDGLDGTLRACSNITLVRFSKEYLSMIDTQDFQKGSIEALPDKFGDVAAHNPHNYALIDSNGEIVSLCGVLEHPKRVGNAWAVHSRGFKDHVIEVTRIVRAFFNDLSLSGAFDYFLGHVKHDFDEGHKWMRLLKFKLKEERESYSLYERFV